MIDRLLTYKQFLWVSQHGDRDYEDVFEDGKGFYIIMDRVPHHIPKDNQLKMKYFTAKYPIVELI